MKVPNYIFCIVGSWILIYISVYYVVFQPKSKVDSSKPVTNVLISNEEFKRLSNHTTYEENPFLSDQCIGVIEHDKNQNNPFKKGVAILVAHNVDREYLRNTVRLC